MASVVLSRKDVMIIVYRLSDVTRVTARHRVLKLEATNECFCVLDGWGSQEECVEDMTAFSLADLEDKVSEHFAS